MWCLTVCQVLLAPLIVDSAPGLIDSTWNTIHSAIIPVTHTKTNTRIKSNSVYCLAGAFLLPTVTWQDDAGGIEQLSDYLQHTSPSPWRFFWQNFFNGQLYFVFCFFFLQFQFAQSALQWWYSNKCSAESSDTPMQMRTFSWKHLNGQTWWDLWTQKARSSAAERTLLWVTEYKFSRKLYEVKNNFKKCGGGGSGKKH